MFEIVGGGARTVGRAALSKTLRRLGLGLACRALDLLSEHAEPPVDELDRGDALSLAGAAMRSMPSVYQGLAIVSIPARASP